MTALTLLSDQQLLDRMTGLIHAERACVADVIEHLIEIDHRRLFLDQACSSLWSYCVERLGYSDDEASKRMRVARLASRFPQVIDEIRAGAIHLTGLFLLSKYVTNDNIDELLAEARGRTRAEIEQLIAARFPRPDVPDRIAPIPEQLSVPGPDATATCPGPSRPSPSPPASGAPGFQPRLEPVSAARWSVQFTADGKLREKIDRATELVSHALPNGDLAALFERALDALIENESKRKLGAGRPRKKRPLKEGSRHIPVEIARQVRERDGNRCTFVDARGRRCSARRFLTIEHLDPYACGGPPTVENLCLLCSAHNLDSARKVFGASYIDAKIEKREASAKVHRALCVMGFSEAEARRAMQKLSEGDVSNEFDPLIRAALDVLVPSKTVMRVSDRRSVSYQRRVASLVARWQTSVAREW